MRPTVEQLEANVFGGDRPNGYVESARYIGTNERLRGHTALVGASAYGRGVAAQFDDYDTGRALGWHSYPASDFELAELDEDNETGVILSELLGL